MKRTPLIICRVVIRDDGFLPMDLATRRTEAWVPTRCMFRQAESRCCLGVCLLRHAAVPTWVRLSMVDSFAHFGLRLLLPFLRLSLGIRQVG
jgi:hypothetical protein